MALSIKAEEADGLARELAAATDETITEAVVVSLRERLERVHASAGTNGMRARLERLAATYRAAEIAEPRTADEIIGYDESGVPG